MHLDLQTSLWKLQGSVQTKLIFNPQGIDCFISTLFELFLSIKSLVSNTKCAFYIQVMTHSAETSRAAAAFLGTKGNAPYHLMQILKLVSPFLLSGPKKGSALTSLIKMNGLFYNMSTGIRWILKKITEIGIFSYCVLVNRCGGCSNLLFQSKLYWNNK